MGDQYSKVLFTGRDVQGHELWLVRFDEGLWGILMDGQCSAMGWPAGELRPAAQAYRDSICLPEAPSGCEHLKTPAGG